MLTVNEGDVPVIYMAQKSKMKGAGLKETFGKALRALWYAAGTIPQ